MKLHDEGFAVLAIDYRGFGRSEAACPQKSAYEDADAAWAELKRRRQVQRLHLRPLARRRHRRASRCHASRAGMQQGWWSSSFTSVREMQQYGVRVDSLAAVQTQFSIHLAKAPKLCVPTLVMHGSNDYRIPVGGGASSTLRRPSLNAGCWWKALATSTSRPATPHSGALR